MTTSRKMRSGATTQPVLDRAETRARQPGLIRAEVLEVIDPDTVLVRSRKSPPSEVLRAEIAVVGYAPAVGDGVIIERGDDTWYVLGALGAARRRRAEGEEVQRFADGALVATFPASGGVELRVREGDLTLSAAGRIVLRAGEVETAADLVRTTATEIVTHAGRVEVEAGRIVERAGDIYCHVEGLAELQAGRARTLVEGAYQLVAKKTTVTSDEDTIIDGKRVLLG
jgi:uncharacterized protein DUF3540